MANFTTHIAVGTLVSGALATLTLAAEVVYPENVAAVALAGVVGSVLPDIDLKDSRPSQALFSGLAVFLSFCALFSVVGKYSIAEMWIVWIGTYLLINYGAQFIFHRMSYHRGIYHSLLAGVFFAFLTAAVYYYLLGRPDGVAWLAAGFMLAGYVTHLVLDEIYSVDVLDTRIKASFGTALKLFDYKHLGHSAAMAAAVALVFLVTPPAGTFVSGISSKQLWSGLNQKLLPPHDKWFGVDVRRLVSRAPAEGGGDSIVTGSIGKAGEAAKATAPTPAQPAPASEAPAEPKKP